MALPTKEDIQYLGFSLNGSPTINITAKSNINPDYLEYSFNGSPWWGVGGEGSTPAPTFKIFAGETAVTKMYVGNAAVSKVYLGSTLIQEF